MSGLRLRTEYGCRLGRGESGTMSFLRGRGRGRGGLVRAANPAAGLTSGLRPGAALDPTPNLADSEKEGASDEVSSAQGSARQGMSNEGEGDPPGESTGSSDDVSAELRVSCIQYECGSSQHNAPAPRSCRVTALVLHTRHNK